MPKKKPLKLPQVSGVTPRAGRPLSRAQLDDSEQERPKAAEQSERSTCVPGSIGCDVQYLSEAVGSSLGFAGRLGPAEPEEWEVQTAEDILRDARRQVRERSPWREELDEALLELRRESERQDRSERSFHVIMPDNRVRAVEDQLSRRVRAQLLGEQAAEVQPPRRAPRRPPGPLKPPAQRKIRNPWYLSPSTWYSGKVDAGEQAGGSFPYDAQILRTGAKPAHASNAADEQDAGDGSPRRLTQRDKETLQIVEAYRQYMKGSRLPHFLQ